MESTSRKNTLRRCGHIWNTGYDIGVDWKTTIADRFTAVTWPFGGIHQSKVFVKYDLQVEGKSVGSPEVGICLHHGKTREEAMDRGLKWIDGYIKTGPENPETVFEYCYKHYASIYPHRNAVIDHWFFVIGNGYDWLDGSVINDSPDSHAEYLENKKNEDSIDYYFKSLPPEFKEKLNKEREQENIARIEYYQGDKIRFYPVSPRFSLICHVPDDVKPEWLGLAYEAAILLRDNSGVPESSKYGCAVGTDKDWEFSTQERNKNFGISIVESLEKRFPQLKL